VGLLREAIALNLDAVPQGVDLGAVEALLQRLPGVLAVEELHVWGLSTSRTALTAHLLIDPLAETAAGLTRDQLLGLARQQLAELGIGKSTLQLATANPTKPPKPVAPSR
jgi:cobalt-zinc-cadmium efflux system protein